MTSRCPGNGRGRDCTVRDPGFVVRSAGTTVPVCGAHVGAVAVRLANLGTAVSVERVSAVRS